MKDNERDLGPGRRVIRMENIGGAATIWRCRTESGGRFPSQLWVQRQLRSALVSAIVLMTTAIVGAQGANPGPVSPGPVSPEPGAGAIENSVVKVFTTMRFPDLGRPWAKQPPREITGSGVVIEGRRILTNAHMVIYASQVQVQAYQSGDKVSATVEVVAPGIDLALLKLDDESFFANHPPVQRAQTLPAVKDTVMAYGYPTGGTSLSTTKGIVSRIEFAPYNFPVGGLRIQIDAAINPGNSGGPAVVGDKMIGLAFSRLGGNTENIGYIIPCEEIEIFLQDVADGHYDGKPGFFDETQTLENQALRAWLKLDGSVHGLVVRAPFRDDPAYPLKEWDVITRIGDTPIDDQGMIPLGHDLRVRFAYLVQKVAKDGKVPLTVVRAGKEIGIELPVSPVWPRVLPMLNGAYPSYFIWGPLVFSNATEDFVRVITNAPNGRGAMIETYLSAVGNPLVTRRGDKLAFPGEQLVVIPGPFLPNKLAVGYGNPGVHVVRAVNGIPIKNLLHLVSVLRDSTSDFITIQFAGREAESLVFPRKEMMAATDEVLNDNGIRSQGTPDAMEVWNPKPARSPQ